MTKQETYAYLSARGIRYEITEHGAVYNMAEIEKLSLPYPEQEAKNLFVRDKKHNYYMLTIKGDKRADLKAFRMEHALRPLSFASPQELRERLDLTPGAVTPLGLLNDMTGGIPLYIDAAFEGAFLGVHPNDNTATIWLKTADLIALLREHGNKVVFAEF